MCIQHSKDYIVGLLHTCKLGYDLKSYSCIVLSYGKVLFDAQVPGSFSSFS